jgi:hypothetical protein
MVSERIYQTSSAPAVRDVEIQTIAASFRRISWGAIIAAVFVSLGVHLLLTLLGAGVGFSTIDPTAPGGTPEGGTLGLTAGIWWALSGILAALIGGWVAVRLAGTVNPTLAWLHGLTAWAVTTVIVLWTLSMLAGTAVAGAFNVAGGALSGLTQAVGAVAPAAGEQSAAIDDMLGELPGGATEQSRAALRDAMTAFLSGDQSARQSAIEALTATGMTPQEAEAQVAEWQRTYDESVRAAERTAEVATDTASTVAFYGFVSLLLGAIAGAIGGWLGRPQDIALEAAH